MDYIRYLINFIGINNEEILEETWIKYICRLLNQNYSIISLIGINLLITYYFYRRNQRNIDDRLKIKYVTKNYNKTEEYCRSIVEKLFNRPFTSIRPNWLNNPKTGRNLELDMYNDQLKLAFEYNGIQHNKYTPRFHRTQDDFTKQVERDEFKQQICSKNGITLITIPHTIGKNKLKNYIIEQCNLSGIPI